MTINKPNRACYAEMYHITGKIKASRTTIPVAWLITSAVSSALTSTISILYWQFTYIQEPGVNWRPLDELIGMLVMMPFGWFAYLAFPPGWVTIYGLWLSLQKTSLTPLILSILASAFFGFIWPKWFVAMMGV